MIIGNNAWELVGGETDPEHGEKYRLFSPYNLLPRITTIDHN